MVFVVILPRFVRILNKLIGNYAWLMANDFSKGTGAAIALQWAILLVVSTAIAKWCYQLET